MKEFKKKIQTNKLLGLKSSTELYRPSDRRLLAKLVQTHVDRGCHMVSVTDSSGRIPFQQQHSSTISGNFQ
jgi:hypothetical protein